MSAIKRALPLLSRHEGVWDGMYRHYDAGGRLVDEHSSRLVCRFPDSGPHAGAYHQTNHYRWADGRSEVRDFPAAYRDGRLWFDNELIHGWAAEVGLDTHQRTVMLYWQRQGQPELELYEMIQLADDGVARHRIWHWYRAGRIVQRTAIDETRVSARWQGIAGASYAGDPLPD